MPPLPHNFFSTASNPTETDLHILRSRTLLQTALSLPSLHRFIADWLFTSPSLPFHPQIQLPSGVFSNTLCFQIHHQHIFQQSKKPPPSIATPSHYSSTSNLLLVPVNTTPPHTLGYVFGTDLCHHFSGRFVFDASTGAFLLIVHGLPSIPDIPNVPKVTRIMYVHHTDKGRQHVFLTFPTLEYSFACLPNLVLSLTTAQSAQESTHNIYDQIDAGLQLDDWDRVFNSLKQLDMPDLASLDLFQIHNQTQIHNHLHTISSLLTGYLHGYTFQDSSSIPFVANMERVGEQVQQNLTKYALHLYHANTNLHRSLSISHNNNKKQLIVEMRKRRNRLSAQKSNEKRRQLMDHKKTQQRLLKQRVSTLLITYQRLKSENQALKKQLYNQ